MVNGMMTLLLWIYCDESYSQRQKFITSVKMLHKFITSVKMHRLEKLWCDLVKIRLCEVIRCLVKIHSCEAICCSENVIGCYEYKLVAANRGRDPGARGRDPEERKLKETFLIRGG